MSVSKSVAAEQIRIITAARQAELVALELEFLPLALGAATSLLRSPSGCAMALSGNWSVLRPRQWINLRQVDDIIWILTRHSGRDPNAVAEPV